MSPMDFFFSRKNDSQQNSEFSHTFRIVQNIFFAILLLCLRIFFFMIEGLNQQVIDCVSRFH